MRKMLFLIIILLRCFTANAQTSIDYTPEDSTIVVGLMNECAKVQLEPQQRILYIARQLKSKPYVAHTLERKGAERLVINLRELDCTTLVENVAAMHLCLKNGTTTFNDFCNTLRKIRYDNGIVDYTTRLHYFSQWIESNASKGYVAEIQPKDSALVSRKAYAINYMSSNPEKYSALTENPHMIDDIKRNEQLFDGRYYTYIPKNKLKNTKALKSSIKDGDIIAIVTNKKGLDISHVGYAVWHNNTLHLLNASSIHKKVVEEPMTLFQYMSHHPSQIGIRIIRIL